MTKDENEITETDNINHIDPFLSGLEKKEIKMMNEKEMKELAEEHYKCAKPLMHMLFIDAFIDGFKHGQEEKNKTKKKTPDYEGYKSYITEC